MREIQTHLSESALRALERIADLTGKNLQSDWFDGYPHAEQLILNFERWIGAIGSPAFYLDTLESSEARGVLLAILSASQPVAQMLIQDPELGSLLLDPAELGHRHLEDEIVEQGRRLLEASTSYSHSLDRLRYLKGRLILPIVANDLGGGWEPPAVWKALSHLANAIIRLTLEVSWLEFRRGKELPEVCPVSVVGFGKLGGDELNFSSDVDLVFVTNEDPDPSLSRFCEAFVRALTDKMGRGQLYRVDMRLRPFGGAGPLVCSIRSVENYYRLYAEPWEIQALIRSRVIVGDGNIEERWEAMRFQRCFPEQVPSEAIESVVAMRARTEAGAEEADIKRGSGGIRDVEFLVQILQMVHGHREPSLRMRTTLHALQKLHESGILDKLSEKNLAEGYTFLRQLEHRIQFEEGAQTHNLPTDAGSQERLAHLMGFDHRRELLHRLAQHRRTIETLYQAALHPERSSSHRSSVAEGLGHSAGLILQWFDVLPEADAFYGALLENRDSLHRVRKLAMRAPRLVPYFQQSVELTELLLSGEIEETKGVVQQIDELGLEATPRKAAQTYTNAWVHLCAAWALTDGLGLEQELAELADHLVRHVCKRLQVQFDLIGLGSFASRSFALDSDADLVILIGNPGRHADAEMNAQLFLSFFLGLKRLGAPITVDFRLRPDGRAGMLARTYEGFAKYELEGMEMWERFALGQSRLLFGDEKALALVKRAAYAQPLTPERLKELLAMKKRIETERVLPQYEWRDVKLGLGGLGDIEWFVHLHEMRYPSATRAGEQSAMTARLKALAEAKLINALELDHLQEAYKHLLRVRLWLGLQDHKDDRVPENPDKLDRLGTAVGFESGISFLSYHTNVIHSVRAIYLEGMERLRA